MSSMEKDIYLQQDKIKIDSLNIQVLANKLKERGVTK